jgi:hypothetical protein
VSGIDVGDEGARSERLTIRFSPGAKLPRVHLTEELVRAPPFVAERNMSSFGSATATTTFDAMHDPLLIMLVDTLKTSSHEIFGDDSVSIVNTGPDGNATDCTFVGPPNPPLVHE